MAEMNKRMPLPRVRYQSWRANLTKTISLSGYAGQSPEAEISGGGKLACEAQLLPTQPSLWRVF
jgi:hypothetical protein